MDEKFTLNWPTFADNLQLMFKHIYEEGKFSDVTLVCDDQTQFKAHKIVISACSPVFKKIIDNNPSQHPMIYLRGILSYEIESILQFMYLGEGRFYYERMGEFIKVAKDLQVKDISKGVEKEDVNAETVVDDEEETEEDDEPKQVAKQSNLQRHIQSQHEGIKYPCDQCDYQATEKNGLQKHNKSKHEGINYICDKCNYQATKLGDLRRHIQSKHEGIKYPCNQCYYQATQQGTLQRHIQSKHKGIKYPCDQCDYQATQQGDLRRHIQSKHEGLNSPCNQCHRQFKTMGSLQRHIQSRHAHA